MGSISQEFQQEPGFLSGGKRNCEIKPEQTNTPAI